MRLIDADALQGEIYKRYTQLRDDCLSINQQIVFDYERVLIANMIDNASTVDPVKHAHWVRTNEMRNKHLYYLKCSACDYKSEDPLYYCGFCGAHMNEGMQDDDR